MARVHAKQLSACLNGFNVRQHYTDDRSQFKVQTDERTRVYSAQHSLNDHVHPSKQAY